MVSHRKDTFISYGNSFTVGYYAGLVMGCGN